MASGVDLKSDIGNPALRFPVPGILQRKIRQNLPFLSNSAGDLSTLGVKMRGYCDEVGNKPVENDKLQFSSNYVDHNKGS